MKLHLSISIGSYFAFSVHYSTLIGSSNDVDILIPLARVIFYILILIIVSYSYSRYLICIILFLPK